jgi:nucleotide sugar dehydrogenase
MLPILEDASGLKAGADFQAGYSPERIDPGNATYTLETTPKVVSGIDAASLARVQGFYDDIVVRTVPVRSPKEAELTKLLENTFRHVNIALVNELAMFARDLGIDVWEAIDAAESKPFGFMPFRPGPGVGGHCIPVDPYYLSWRAREFDFVERFIELAGDINLGMPRHVVDLAADALNERGRSLKGSRIGVVGAAFKPDVQDARNTPASDVIALLAARGAIVSFHDPLVPELRDAAGKTHKSVGFEELLSGSDLLVVVTAHHQLDWDAIFERADLIVDTVNSSRGRVRRANQVLRLGAGWASPDFS